MNHFGSIASGSEEWSYGSNITGGFKALFNSVDAFISSNASSGGAPTLPSNKSVGTPAYKMLSWGSYQWTYQTTSGQQQWFGDGWSGWKAVEGGELFEGFGGTEDMIGSDASALNTTIYNTQQRLENSGSTLGTAAQAKNVGMEMYMGWYFTDGFVNNPNGGGLTTLSKSLPPYGNWFNDTQWTRVNTTWQRMAQAMQFLGMTGLTFDWEFMNWGNSRPDPSCKFSSGSSVITDWNIAPGDQGASVSGAGIPANSFVGTFSGTLYPTNGGVTGASFTLVNSSGNSVNTTANSGGGASPNYQNLTITNNATSVNLKAKSRGFDLAVAIWGAKPDLILGIYSYSLPGGWGQLIQNVVNNQVYPNLNVQSYFFQGLLDGMRSIAATGRIVIADATFYRMPSIALSGANNIAASILNTQAIRAYWSTFMDQSIWNYACDHVDITQFTWLSCDTPGTYYCNNKPSDSDWANTMLPLSREYSEGIRRWEYNFEQGGWPGATPTVGDTVDRYIDTTSITGSQNAASQTKFATVPPTISSITTSVSGTNITITCNSTHNHGIRFIKVYDGATFSSSNPSASYLGAMQMTWNQNAGTYQTNFNNAFQQCTFTTTTGGHGHWYVLQSVSTKDDEFWTSIQAA